MNKLKRYKKSEITQISHEICDILEAGKPDEFFHCLAGVLKQRVEFGSLQPLGQILGLRGRKKPELYFDILDKFYKKDFDFDYESGLYDLARLKMSEAEVQKSRVLGWRAGIIGLAFDEISTEHPELVLARTKEYVLLGNHWSCADTFADKAFNRLYVEKFAWTLTQMKAWAQSPEKWLRNTAAFSTHAPVERKLVNESQTCQLLELLALLMQDSDTNVKQKVGWALRVISKYFPDPVYEFLLDWAPINDKNTKWMVKNGSKFLSAERKEYLLGDQNI